MCQILQNDSLHTLCQVFSFFLCKTAIGLRVQSKEGQRLQDFLTKSYFVHVHKLCISLKDSPPVIACCICLIPGIVYKNITSLTKKHHSVNSKMDARLVSPLKDGRPYSCQWMLFGLSICRFHGGLEKTKQKQKQNTDTSIVLVTQR